MIFQKELMLVRQANQKNACFVIIGIFHIKFLVMDHIFVMTAIIFLKNLEILKILLLLILKKIHTEFIFHVQINRKQRN